MLTGQVIVFLIILQTALAIEAQVSESRAELDRVSTLSSMEIASENVMLDCCLRLHAWAIENPGTTADLIAPLAIDWEKGMEEYLSMGGWGCDLSLEGITAEPLANQTIDPLQAGFLGRNGDERIFISAMLVVSIEVGDLAVEATYLIRISS